LNRLRRTGNWTRLTLRGTRSSADAVGARLRLTVRAGDGVKTMTRQVEAGSGYASQSDMAVHFGLGGATAIDALEVLWPSGQKQCFAGRALDRLVNQAVYLEEGGGFRTSYAEVTGLRARR
jgi:hypothetical protein